MISAMLSALVVEARGRLIFGTSSEPRGPVQWLNPDVVARCLNASRQGAESTQRLQVG